MRQPSFGRIMNPDPRDHDYLVRSHAALLGAPIRPKRRTWYLPMSERLNQGAKPHCVGFSWKHFLRSEPRVRGAAIAPSTIYAEAQKVDGIPGEAYDGTTVRGGAVYLKKSVSVVATYRWAFNVNDALDACGLVGPLVLGTDWYEGMLKPDAGNDIHRSGRVVGGHAYLLIGYDDARGLALIQNSWGTSWGIGGRAYLPYQDLEALIDAGGEACIATEV